MNNDWFMDYASHRVRLIALEQEWLEIRYWHLFDEQERRGWITKNGRHILIGSDSSSGGRKSGKKVDKRRESGIIEENNESSGHTYEKIGKIDFSDKKAIAKSLQEFEHKYSDSDVEHCRVICTNGEVYDVHGDLDTVDTTLLGDKLKGSINEHNHVTGRSQYSFSWEDLSSCADDGTKTAIAFDEKFRYSMTFPEKHIPFDTVYNAYEKAKFSVLEDMFGNPESIPEGDEQNAIINRVCKELKIKYSRIAR